MRLPALALLAALALPAAASAAPLGSPTVPAKRDTEPVVLKGAQLAEWSVPSNLTLKLPLLDLPESGQCAREPATCDHHNDYAEPEVDTAEAGQPQGTTPVDRLAGYRYHPRAGKYQRVPLQVDEMFVRYLDNSASGFAWFSGQDQHLSYAFDREGFRFWDQDPENPCLSRPAGGRVTTPDPIGGLDNDDEIALMASDAGPPAPPGTPLPKHVTELRAVAVTDPYEPGETRYVYIGRTTKPLDLEDSYVTYRRDANADLFEKSESNYENYGNARKGVVCDADGNVVAEMERRRPRDTATVTTPRYRFRYDGRWLMTDVRVSSDGGETYGRDLVDRWKARAFQQDPSSDTPCCGYEEEDTNWGGSSTLLGEKSGPVRTIRETWGADSGTNVIRRETFYRDEVRLKSFLRVHVIPPLDGIYAQWDFNAGVVDRYYTSKLSGDDRDTAAGPGGVAIDGKNDEVFGNLDDPCNGRYDKNSTSDTDQAYRGLYRQIPGLCNAPYHQSIDLPDPTRSELNAGQQWHVTTGDHGTFVDRHQIDDVTEQSAGGLAQSMVVAVPYYRDDSCFDDGTGSDPGPRVKPRSRDEPTHYTAPDGTRQPRECWTPAHGDPAGTGERFFQGSIGTHGIHLLFVADSDNARQTVPVSEIVGEQRIVLLPGRHGAEVGEQYGRGFEKPLVATVLPR